MDMELYEKDGKTYTRLKISIKRFWTWKSYIKTKYMLKIRQRKAVDIFILRLREI